MIRLAKAIVGLLEEGEHLVLATILAQAGSTPRASGAQMIIRADGRIIGTVGGGRVEAEIMRAGADLMATSTVEVRSYNLGLGGASDTMDMLCGGHLEVLLEPLAPIPETVGFYRQVADTLARGRRGLIVTALPRPDSMAKTRGKWLVDRHGVGVGREPVPEELSKKTLADAARLRGPMRHPARNPRFLFEPLFVPGTVFLFGAGHVSQAVATLTRMTGFRTVVRDDREAFANRQRFPEVEAVEVIEAFDCAFAGLTVDTDSYIVIVTRGHRHDGTVLAQALASSAGYIGMIGSRNKRDAVYADMKSRGFSSRDLTRVHSPVGLAIGAETPEEIAVSIVAELIAARAGLKTRNEP